MRKPFPRKRWIFAIALFVSLLAVQDALAGYFAIDTNDAIRDPAWESQPALLTDEGTEAAGYDIVAFWMSRTDPNDADTSEFYNFNVQIRSNGPLPDDLTVSVWLSCDNDANFEEEDDRLVEFDTFTDAAWIYDGYLSYLDTNADWGESVSWTYSGTKFGAEFKASAQDLGSCATLNNPIKVKLESLDASTPGDQTADTTGEATFDTTSAVTLKEFNARSERPDSGFLAAASLLTLSLTLFIWNRKRLQG